MRAIYIGRSPEATHQHRELYYGMTGEVTYSTDRWGVCTFKPDGEIINWVMDSSDIYVQGKYE